MSQLHPPYDEQAELDLIATTMIRPDRLVDIAGELSPEDFYQPRWRACWAAFLDLHRSGIRPDPTTLADAARKHGFTGTPADLLSAQINGIPIHSDRQAQIVLRHRHARDLLFQCQGAMSAIAAGDDPYVVSDNLQQFIRGVGAYNREPQAENWYDFIHKAQEHADWLIPGLLRTNTKGLLIGGEGAGKMTQLRCMAMGLAQGFHPYTHHAIEPQRTLLFDMENSHHAISETGAVLERSLRELRGDTYDYDAGKIVHEIRGLRVRRRQDRAAFIREIAAHRPALVCVGPLGKLHSTEKGESYEDAAEKTQQILDDIQEQFGFALVIEHHAPKGDSSKRDLVPMGSQRWMGWPEFGIGLRADADDQTTLLVEHYRVPRIKLAWPTEIYRDARFLVRGRWANGDMP